MSELVESAEDEAKSATSSASLAPPVAVASTVAQSVRIELELLAERSVASDASKWKTHSGRLLSQGVYDKPVDISSIGGNVFDQPKSMSGASTASQVQSPLQEMRHANETEILPHRRASSTVGTNAPNASLAEPLRTMPIPTQVQVPSNQMDHTTPCINQPGIGQAPEQMPCQSTRPLIANMIPSSECGSLERLLPPEQRFACQNYPGEAIWTSGDATLDTIAGISWADKQFFVLGAPPLVRPFKRNDSEEVIIGECELLVTLTIAIIWGLEKDGWGGDMDSMHG